MLLMAVSGAWAQVAITTDLADSYDAKVGIPITLSIEANNATGYQWYQVSSSEKETIIAGATSSSYTFTPTEVGEYKFFCMAMGEANLYDLTKVTTVIAALPQTYSVTLKEGTEDEGNWSVPKEAAEGSPVTVTYSGEKKVKSVKAVKKAPADPLAVPMTIEAITEGQIRVISRKEGMQYSLNGGAKTAVTTGEIVLNAGDKVQFYGNGTTITSYGSSSASDCTRISGIGDGFTCKVYGNIMSLVDEENFATAKTLSATYTFRYLFYNNRTLTDASGLLLPATTLAANCYERMFGGCSALTAAPEELPAETLAAYCYYQMFQNCTALTTAPVLPAPTLVQRCYQQMFTSCRKLATVTCLATSGINQDNSTTGWLQSAGTEVEGTKTVYTSSSADWPTGNNGIPHGWTRVDVDN